MQPFLLIGVFGFDERKEPCVLVQEMEKVRDLRCRYQINFSLMSRAKFRVYVIIILLSKLLEQESPFFFQGQAMALIIRLKLSFDLTLLHQLNGFKSLTTL